MQNTETKPKPESRTVMTDGSKLIIESIIRAGADVYIGYPITPANLLYLYSSKLFKHMLPAPDEITTLQWMCGFAAAGKLPVTATSFAGFALMVESINMAYMMELPMVIVLSQRLGPSTGTATCGAQGDVGFIRGMISGGYPLPTLCPSDYVDCWDLGAAAVKWAWEMKTPVILLSSKEMIMTLQSFDLNLLKDVKPVDREFYQPKEGEEYKPYKPTEDLSRAFLPVGNDKCRVRLTASTHNQDGLLRHSTPEAIGNTKRLRKKLITNLDNYTHYDYDKEDGAETLVVSYGITAKAAREAVKKLRNDGKKISLLIVKTLFPAPEKYLEIIDNYSKIVIAEENLTGHYKETLFGEVPNQKVICINGIAKLITPQEIIKGVTQ